MFLAKDSARASMTAEAGQAGEKLLQRVGAVLALEFLRRAFREQFALGDDGDAIAHAFDDIEHMGAVHDRLAFAGEGFEQGLEADSGIRIEAIERFVEQHHFRIVQQGGGDDDLAPHAFGISAEELGGECLLIQLEEIKELADAGPRLVLVDAVKRPDHEQELESGEGFINRARIRDETE
jgi:hypothetical protein